MSMPLDDLTGELSSALGSALATLFDRVAALESSANRTPPHENERVATSVTASEVTRNLEEAEVRMHRAVEACTTSLERRVVGVEQFRLLEQRVSTMQARQDELLSRLADRTAAEASNAQWRESVDRRLSKLEHQTGELQEELAKHVQRAAESESESAIRDAVNTAVGALRLEVVDKSTQLSAESEARLQRELSALKRAHEQQLVAAGEASRALHAELTEGCHAARDQAVRATKEIDVMLRAAAAAPQSNLARMQQRVLELQCELAKLKGSACDRAAFDALKAHMTDGTDVRLSRLETRLDEQARATTDHIDALRELVEPLQSRLENRESASSERMQLLDAKIARKLDASSLLRPELLDELGGAASTPEAGKTVDRLKTIQEAMAHLVMMVHRLQREAPPHDDLRTLPVGVDPSRPRAGMLSRPTSASCHPSKGALPRPSRPTSAPHLHRQPPNMTQRLPAAATRRAALHERAERGPMLAHSSAGIVSSYVGISGAAPSPPASPKRATSPSTPTSRSPPHASVPSGPSTCS